MIFLNDLRIGDQQVGFEYISIGEHISCHHSRGNIVCLIIYGVLQEFDHGIFVQQLVELFCQVSADNVYLIDSGFQTGVDQSVDDTLSMDTHQGLRRIKSNRYQTAAESRCDENCALGTIRL